MPASYINVYTSFVTKSHLYVKGRILKTRTLRSIEHKGILSALYNTFLRAMSAEYKFHALNCRYAGKDVDLMTDDEGYFEIFENIEHLDWEDKSLSVITRIKGQRVEKKINVRTYLHQMPVGVISDIDDTIMLTGVKSFFKFKVVLNTLFLHPFKRKPIESAAEAFNTLVDHTEGRGPVIYLSNSPWNIFDYLQAFLRYNKFPPGEIILRDMGFQLLKKREIIDYNKYREIEKMLILFPDTKFILVGDTGEKDYDIYKAIFSKHSDRVERIILNKAGNHTKEKMIEDLHAVDPNYQLLNGFKELLELK